MLSEEFQKIISGKGSGLLSFLLFLVLRFSALPYSVIVRIRNLLYDKKILPIHKIPVFTVSVGNLTLGGTGKSPMCAFLVRHFLDKGFFPGIISRGYGENVDKNNDEFLELALQFPNVPHIQNPDRIIAAEKLLEENPDINVIILDDAMQHRRIARDVNIVLLDAAEPFGFNRIFPAGFLREPAAGLRRADAVILTRCNYVLPKKITEVKQQVKRIVPNIIIAETVHLPQALLTREHQSVAVSAINGKQVFAFCGIGNPEAFRRTLSDCGSYTTGFLAFPDHHRYTAEDLQHIKDEAVKCNAEIVVCTVKDIVKIPPDEGKDFLLYALSIQICFTSGEEELKQIIVSCKNAKPA